MSVEVGVGSKQIKLRRFVLNSGGKQIIRL